MPAHREHYSPAAKPQHKLRVNTRFVNFCTGAGWLMNRRIGGYLRDSQELPHVDRDFQAAGFPDCRVAKSGDAQL
jgi:hypothetical protein